jgi:hypothetical protein
LIRSMSLQSMTSSPLGTGRGGRTFRVKQRAVAPPDVASRSQRTS